MQARATKKARRGRKPGVSVVAARAASKNGSLDLVTIAAAKELVGRLGADTAKQLIDLLA